jgi:hypothetical protein
MACVDIAGVASSILATPTMKSLAAMRGFFVFCALPARNPLSTPFASIL